MKNTMKIFSVATLVLMGYVWSACSETEIQGIESLEENIIIQTTTVSFDSESVDPETRALALDIEGGALTKTFAAGDKIAVVYENTGSATVMVESAALAAEDISSEGKSATFTVALTDPKANGSVKYIYPAAMANADGTVNYDALSSQNGVLATLASNLDLAIYEGALSESATLPASPSLENKLAILAYTLKDATGETDITASVTGLTISDGTNSYSVTREAGEGPIYVAIQPTDNASIEYTATSGIVNYAKSVTAKTYAAGNVYPLGIRMAEESAGSGSGTEDDPYIIKTVNDLLDMKTRINSAGGTYFKLGNDIDMTGVSNWSPVNSSSSAIIYLDGNEKSISNYKISGNVDSGGNAVDPSFFGIFVGECKDLNFKDFDVTVTSGKISHLGVFASEMGSSSADTKLTNVTFNGKFDVGGVQVNADYTCSSAGVLAGITSGKVEVDGCTVNATVNGPMTSDFAPGVNKRGKFTGNKIEQRYGIYFGKAEADITIKNSVCQGQLVIYGKIAGGFIGAVASTTATTLTITNSCNKADIYGGNEVAGFVGKVEAKQATVEDSHNEGHIEAIFDWGDSSNAGIFGSVTKKVVMKRTYNTGFLGFTSNTSGGLIGKVAGYGGSQIENCYCILQNIPNGYSQIGGIVGGGQGGDLEITNCYVAGEGIIARQQGIGGIVGRLTKDNNKAVKGCIVQIGTLTKNMEGDNPDTFDAAGAIVGAVISTENVTLENCWRNSDMVIVGPTNSVPPVVWKQPYDQDNVSSSPSWPVYDTDLYTPENHRPYHGKSMDPGETVSQRAQAIGWDPTVWDFSGDLPKLR